MKNYDPIEQQNMTHARKGALIFWASLAVCIWLAC